jgi:predicted dehydrogenase
MIKVGVIGLGYWGPNFVRNFIRHSDFEVRWVCDLSDQALKKSWQLYPHIQQTSKYEVVLQDTEIDLVMIVTPPETHFHIAKQALMNNKHVLIAKPITLSYKDAQVLLKLAQKKGLLLYGDLTYLYTGAVKYIQHFIKKKQLGIPLYYDSTRTNLGLIQKEVNVIWDLAPHDLAIIDRCFGISPVKVLATASHHVKGSKNFEMAHITLEYDNGFIAHIHVSWVSPIKLRTVLIGGSNKMIFFDDVEPDEKIRIYDKGIDVIDDEITYMKPIYRNGDVLIPKLSNEEAIYIEINEIAKQLKSNKISYENAEINVRLVKLLEACDISIKTNKKVLFRR